MEWGARYLPEDARFANARKTKKRGNATLASILPGLLCSAIMLKTPIRWLALCALWPGAHAAHPARAPKPAESGPRPEVVGFWRFEHDVKSEVRNQAFAAARRPGGGISFFSEDVPGPFIYDPVQRLSYPNTTSLSFQSTEQHSDALELALNTAKTTLAGQNVTLEFFCKPSAEWKGPVAMKARLDDKGSEWGLEARSGERPDQAYVNGFFTMPGVKTEHFRSGRYGSSAQVHNQGNAWRHLAIVYEAASKTLTTYVDYYQAKAMALPGELKWDAGSLFIGGGTIPSTFGGQIDEVRLTKGALRPSQFLRARRDPVAGLTYESIAALLPRDCGYVDLKECFGAIGDGRTDDTPAIREAFRVLSNQPTLDRNTLYIPPGTYLVNDTVLSGRSLCVVGAGSDKTVIKLRDKCPGFTHNTDVRPVWQVDHSKAPAVVGADGNENDAAIAIGHLTIDTGKSNAAAVGLQVASNLLQRIDDLQVRSADGTGQTGVEFAIKGAAAVLVKNVRVKGFDYAIISNGTESQMAYEQIALEGQRLGGLKNVGGIAAVHALTSNNKVSALLGMGASSMTSLLDSSLKGGADDVSAIQCEGGLCLVRVDTAGYKAAIRKRALDDNGRDWKETFIAGPKIEEYVGDQVVDGHGTATGPLKLPAENTPDVPWGDIRQDWVNVSKFAGKKAEDDWAPAIQAAIDSGAKTVYFPPGAYALGSAVHLHGKTDRLFGLDSHLARQGGYSSEEAVLIFDEPNAKRTVAIEGLEVDGLRHTCPATLVLKNARPGHYENAEHCGKLFMENVQGADFQFTQAQNVWARQWNGERHGIFSHGAVIWCLGMSGGGESGVLSSEAGASTEIFGAYLRALPSMSENRPFFANTNARLSVVYGTDVTDPGHALQILDTANGDTKKINSESLRWIGGRGRMDLFRSDPAGK
jgi:hypothetical protein